MHQSEEGDKKYRTLCTYNTVERNPLAPPKIWVFSKTDENIKQKFAGWATNTVNPN